MKTKLLLSALSFLVVSQCMQAQYLVSATQIGYRNAAQVQTFLNNAGYDTAPMTINGIKSYKITYNTIDVHGDPTVASGALYVPQNIGDSLPLVS